MHPLTTLSSFQDDCRTPFFNGFFPKSNQIVINSYRTAKLVNLNAIQQIVIAFKTHRVHDMLGH